MRCVKEYKYNDALIEAYESLNMYLEASAERERVKDFLENKVGKGYFDKYLKLRDRFTDKRLKDFNLIIKMKPADVKVAINRYDSSADKTAITGGKEVVGENSKWTVYHVTSFPAAQELGEGTEWCITGRYGDMNPDDDHYFKDYISRKRLDGGYYFYIPKDGSNNKYCLLLTRNGDVDSLWGTPNGEVGYEEEWDFPEVSGIDLSTIGTSTENLQRELEQAYEEDNADEWSSIHIQLEERDEYVEYPDLEQCISDNKPNIFGMLLDMGFDPSDEIDDLVIDIFDDLSHDSDRQNFLDALGGYLDGFIENADFEEVLGKIFRHRRSDFINYYGDYIPIQDVLSVCGYDINEYLSNGTIPSEMFETMMDNSGWTIDDLIDWVADDSHYVSPEPILKLLKQVSDILSLDPLFADSGKLNLYKYIKYKVCDDDTYEDDIADISFMDDSSRMGDWISGLFSLGARMNRDEAKELYDELKDNNSVSDKVKEVIKKMM